MPIFGSIQHKSCRTILNTGTLIPLCLIILPSNSYQYAQSMKYYLSSKKVQLIRAGTHLWQSNTKLRLYEVVLVWLVQTAHVYHAPSTNRNKPHFDVLTANGLINAIHVAITSRQCPVNSQRFLDIIGTEN